MSTLIVQVEEGKLRGIEKESALTRKPYCAFLGIPYAKAPVGELRFKPPVPSEKWEGVRDASKEGNPCLQMSDTQGNPPVVGSEDCLFLNVYTPEAPGDIKTKKAVMIFIHGGGFMGGSGSPALYGPDYLMGRDIICVTLNYRLHVFGFLNTGTSSCQGNAGLKDQLLAIKWVRKNVSNFGGDPENITLFGESAGAASVHLQMLSPLSKGLFHRAIIESGSCHAPWAFMTNPWSRAEEIGILAGYKGNDPEELVRHLRDVPGEKLCELSNQCQQEAMQGAPGRCDSLSFIPSIENIKDGAFLPDFPENLMKSAPRIPLIIGFNNQEGILLFTCQTRDIIDNLLEDPLIIVKNNFDLTEPEQAELLAEIKKFYFNNAPVKYEGLVELYTDLYFIRFYEAIDYLIKSTVPPYIYFFPYEGKFNINMISIRDKFHLDLTGAAHGDELGYLFHQGKESIDQADRKVIDNCCALWTNFAKYGNPTSSYPKIDWRPHVGSMPCYLTIGEALEVNKAKLNEERFNFWSRWSPKVIRTVRLDEINYFLTRFQRS